MSDSLSSEMEMQWHAWVRSANGDVPRRRWAASVVLWSLSITEWSGSQVRVWYKQRNRVKGLGYPLDWIDSKDNCPKNRQNW